MLNIRKLSLNLKIFLIVLGVGGLFELILVNNSCMAGSKLSKLEQQKSALSSEINSLNNQLSQSRSLGRISVQAKLLGLVDSETSKVKFIGTTEVASVPTNATP